jgi:hypothetical protein
VSGGKLGHGHIHGANLGCSAATYADAGGFALVDHDEDVAFVAAEALAARIGWAKDIAVTTSSRLTGRAPGGFARYLALARVAAIATASATEQTAGPIGGLSRATWFHHT